MNKNKNIIKAPIKYDILIENLIDPTKIDYDQNIKYKTNELNDDHQNAIKANINDNNSTKWNRDGDNQLSIVEVTDREDKEIVEESNEDEVN